MDQLRLLQHCICVPLLVVVSEIRGVVRSAELAGEQRVRAVREDGGGGAEAVIYKLHVVAVDDVLFGAGCDEGFEGFELGGVRLEEHEEGCEGPWGPGGPVGAGEGDGGGGEEEELVEGGEEGDVGVER